MFVGEEEQLSKQGCTIRSHGDPDRLTEGQASQCHKDVIDQVVDIRQHLLTRQEEVTPSDGIRPSGFS